MKKTIITLAAATLGLSSAGAQVDVPNYQFLDGIGGGTENSLDFYDNNLSFTGTNGGNFSAWEGVEFDTTGTSFHLYDNDSGLITGISNSAPTISQAGNNYGDFAWNGGTTFWFLDAVNGGNTVDQYTFDSATDTFTLDTTLANFGGWEGISYFNGGIALYDADTGVLGGTLTGQGTAPLVSPTSGGSFNAFGVTTVTVPEPSSALLLGLSALGFIGRRKR